MKNAHITLADWFIEARPGKYNVMLSGSTASEHKNLRPQVRAKV